MNIPARLIRAVVQDIPGLMPELTPRAQRTRELILIAATKTFAHFGRKDLTMRALSKAICISRDRIEVHFLDVDCVLAEILKMHLRGISRATANAPNTPKDRRAAYFAYTRGPFDCITKEHALFLFERQHLPDDLLPAIEEYHRLLGPLLCPENPARALELLDQPNLDLHEAESLLNRKTAAPLSAPEPDYASATDEELEACCLEARLSAAGTSPDQTSTAQRSNSQTSGTQAALADLKQPQDPPHTALIRHVSSPARPLFARPRIATPPQQLGSAPGGAAALRQPDHGLDDGPGNRPQDGPQRDPPGSTPLTHRAVAAPSSA